MMSEICYLLGQNVTSSRAKVTHKVTPEIPYSIYTNPTFLMNVTLLPQILGLYTEKIL